jgi:hypothetical protein
MSPLTLPHTNGSSGLDSTSDWLHRSVRDFFSHLNWDDRPPEIQVTVHSTETDLAAEPLGLSTSVSKFFSAYNWDGSDIAAPVPTAPTPPISQDSEFTLDDFSGLF